MFMMKGKNRKDVGKRIMSRAEGWLLRTDHFRFDFEHVAGNSNIADAASRFAVRRDDLHFGKEKESHELCCDGRWRFRSTRLSRATCTLKKIL